MLVRSLVGRSLTRQNKSRALDDVHSKYGDRDSDLERTLREKEEELEIFKAGMDQTLLELNEMKMVGVPAHSSDVMPASRPI